MFPKVPIVGIHYGKRADKEHQKVFSKVPIVGFRNGKSLKDHLVRPSLPILNQALGSEPCGKSNCQVC